MARARTVLVLAVLLVSGFADGVPAQIASAIHVVTAGNIACPPMNNCTALAGTSWYYGPQVRYHLATANWNPAGMPGVYFQAPIGNYFFDDGGGIYLAVLMAPHDFEVPLGAAFNLLTVSGVSSCIYYHVATAANTTGNVTFLDRPALNGHPDAFVLVLPGGTTPDPSNVGVYYDSSRLQWGIFNEDLSAMGPRYFTVYDNSCDVGLGERFHLTCVGTAGDSCDLGGIAIGDPRAKIIVNQRWDAGAPIYNPHPIGVYYTAGRWRVFNEDFAAMPAGIQFNVAEVRVLLDDDFETGDLAAWSSSVP